MPRPQRPLDAKPRRDEILDEATRLFAERGYEGTSMADLADRVGMRKASLFYHFASKDELYAAVLDRLMIAVSAAIAHAATAEGSFEQRLDHLTDTMTNVLSEQPYAARIIIRETMDWGPVMRDKLADQVVLVLAAAEGFMRAGQQAGVFAEFDAKQLLVSLIGLHFMPFSIGGLVQKYVGKDVFDAELIAVRRDAVRVQLRRLVLKNP
jgi:AcrR family transcriptional regulator